MNPDDVLGMDVIPVLWAEPIQSLEHLQDVFESYREALAKGQWLSQAKSGDEPTHAYVSPRDVRTAWASRKTSAWSSQEREN